MAHLLKTFFLRARVSMRVSIRTRVTPRTGLRRVSKEGLAFLVYTSRVPRLFSPDLDSRRGVEQSTAGLSNCCAELERFRHGRGRTG